MSEPTLRCAGCNGKFLTVARLERHAKDCPGNHPNALKVGEKPKGKK